MSRPNSLANTTTSAKEAALFEVSDECGDRTVDGLLHLGGAVVAIFMRVPVAERDVFGSDFDEADTFFDESSCEEAAKSEAARVVGVVGGFWFEGEIERLGGRRAEQTVGVVEGSEQAFALVVAAVAQDRALAASFWNAS